MEGAVAVGHQGRVPRRPDRHGGEARVVDPHGAGGERAVLVDEDGRTPIEGTEDAHAVEDVVSAAVHRLAKLKTALMMLGVLRGWPRRTLTPRTLKTGS